jgi:hypothetical protein
VNARRKVQSVDGARTPPNRRGSPPWTFADPRLCAAIVDRLTFNATLIETGTESYRLARSKAEQNGAGK